MAGRYRFTLKSAEPQGAQQPNSVEVVLANDEDAILFAANLEDLFAADVVTVNLMLDQNYDLPYPLGTGTQWRYVMRDRQASVQTERLYNIRDGANPGTFRDAYIASPALINPNGTPVDSIQIAIFTQSSGR